MFLRNSLSRLSTSVAPKFGDFQLVGKAFPIGFRKVYERSVGGFGPWFLLLFFLNNITKEKIKLI